MSHKNLFIFMCGAAVGFTLSWYCAKNKYEKIVQEEIDSVKKVFAKRNTEKTSSSDDQKDISSLSDKLTENGYTAVSENKPENIDIPYVISPDEFGEFDDYERISLTYYADGVLADDNDEIVDNIDKIIGEDSLMSFGEYEDDSVFVRNDGLKCDYEILKDQRKYSDITKIF